MLTIQEYYSLKEHNSFGLDVKARYFVEYESEDDLVQFLAQTDTTSTRLFHIGSGSDLLFTRDFDGYLLHSAIKGIEVLEDKGDSAVLKVGAAVIWDELIKWTINNGYYGLENMSLIPSEVGAAAVQGNAGSFFLNPIVSVDKYEALLQQYPDMPHFPVPSSSDSDDTGQFVKVPAAWLIERAGWKGKNIGRAGVYELQPLVLVNRGGATPNEIVTLAATIIDDVNRKFGITLKPEAIYI